MFSISFSFVFFALVLVLLNALRFGVVLSIADIREGEGEDERRATRDDDDMVCIYFYIAKNAH